MKLVYFAWVRERVGRTDEDVDLPEGVETVADLVRWLKGRGEEGDSDRLRDRDLPRPVTPNDWTRASSAARTTRLAS